MLIPLAASFKATDCGDETTRAPARGMDCEIVRCVSPVPGGRSMMRMSRGGGPHRTWKRSCCRALTTMRPRQTIGLSSDSSAKGVEGLSGAVFGS